MDLGALGLLTEAGLFFFDEGVVEFEEEGVRFGEGSTAFDLGALPAGGLDFALVTEEGPCLGAGEREEGL